MIISASRRTDIPAFYSEWMKNRLREREVLVRNPMRYHQVSRISLSPEAVDGIVFWSKNPAPMLPWISELNQYEFYFQFTLNPYGREVEPGLYGLEERMDVMKRLADEIGQDRVLWRYDPILFNERYTLSWHEEQFGRMSARLKDSAGRCTISFLDHYRGMSRRVEPLSLVPVSENTMKETGAQFGRIGKEYGLSIVTCAERVDLSEFGIGHASCVDGELFERLSGCEYLVEKDKSQRTECGCAQSIDIGQYHTCPHGCMYCYANTGVENVQKNFQGFDPASPLLCGSLSEGDTVTERKMKSSRSMQLSLKLH